MAIDWQQDFWAEVEQRAGRSTASQAKEFGRRLVTELGLVPIPEGGNYHGGVRYDLQHKGRSFYIVRLIPGSDPRTRAIKNPRLSPGYVWFRPRALRVGRSSILEEICTELDDKLLDLAERRIFYRRINNPPHPRYEMYLPDLHHEDRRGEAFNLAGWLAGQLRTRW